MTTATHDHVTEANHDDTGQAVAELNGQKPNILKKLFSGSVENSKSSLTTSSRPPMPKENLGPLFFIKNPLNNVFYSNELPQRTTTESVNRSSWNYNHKCDEYLYEFSMNMQIK